MLTLGNIFVLMLLATAGAWLWHAHGLRERTLALVKAHCAKADIDLLDENVALRKITLLADARGRKRLARIYSFEFTVTGEQRHVGRVVMFGQQMGRIELEPHPFRQPMGDGPQVINARPAPPDTSAEQPNTPRPRTSQVIELDQWRREHRPPRD